MFLRSSLNRLVMMKLNDIKDVYLCTPSVSIFSKNLSLTQHNLIFESDEPDFIVMYKSIDAFRVLESSSERRYTTASIPGYTILLHTKDFLIYEVTVVTLGDCRAVQQSLESLCNINNAQLHYPFYYELPDKLSLSRTDDALINWSNSMRELISIGNWRFTHINQDYSLCDTYPDIVVVPTTIDDYVLQESGRFRAYSRFPTLVYYHKPRKTALLIASEPVTDTSAQANARNNSITNSLNVPQSINRCRSDEQLLATILPDKYCGAILDLRTQNETKKPPITSSFVESDQYYPHWRRICRPMESTANVNVVYRKFIDACTSPGRSVRSITNSLGALQTGMITDSFNSIISNSTFTGFTNSTQRKLNESADYETHEENVNAKINVITQNFNALDLQSSSNAGRSVNSSSPLSSLLSSSSSSTTITTTNASTTSSVAKLKRFSAWLALVREALAAAVAGAVALDALDTFAQQQLLQEQCLLAEKQRSSGRMQFSKSNNEEAKLRGSFVLVQSRSGRDRALVVASLIQIILNPVCRTIHGFQTLIDYTWIRMGHAFFDRYQNSAFSTRPIKSESPVFILFLDCVWQLLRQYPNAFEFTSKLLVLLAKHVYFSEFGTFLGNSIQERSQLQLNKKTYSLWSYLNQSAITDTFRNPFYSDSASDSYACWPCLAPQALDVWQELYQSHLIGEHNSVLTLPHSMSKFVMQQFQDECRKACELRDLLHKLQTEAIEANLLTL